MTENERAAMLHLLAVVEDLAGLLVARTGASGETDRLQRRISEAQQLLDGGEVKNAREGSA